MMNYISILALFVLCQWLSLNTDWQCRIWRCTSSYVQLYTRPLRIQCGALGDSMRCDELFNALNLM
jgi:hypothetical protein